MSAYGWLPEHLGLLLAHITLSCTSFFQPRHIKWVVDRLKVWLLFSNTDGRLIKEGEWMLCIVWGREEKANVKTIISCRKNILIIYLSKWEMGGGGGSIIKAILGNRMRKKFFNSKTSSKCPEYHVWNFLPPFSSVKQLHVPSATLLCVHCIYFKLQLPMTYVLQRSGLM